MLEQKQFVTGRKICPLLRHNLFLQRERIGKLHPA
jgi:hypothetical protein